MSTYNISDSAGTEGAYIHSMTSYSGADIRAVLGGVEIGEIQQVSWAITREKGGVFVLGDENARSFSRGRRYIAGSMSFGFFSRDAVLEQMKMSKAAGMNASAYQYFEWRDKGPNLNDDGGQSLLDATGLGELPDLDPRSPDVGGAAVREILLGRQRGNSPRVLTTARYADQILPFNITIVAGNEYGNHARMAILGVEFVNTQSGFAVETLQSDQQYTFIAREIMSWKRGTPGSLGEVPTTLLDVKSRWGGKTLG